MLCSECRHEIKPVVAIDLDGTLGDYHGHWIRFVRQYLDLPPLDLDEQYDGDEPYFEWFLRTFDVDLSTFRAIKLAYRQGGLKRSMPTFDDAARLCRDLRSAGAELWLTTTRPHDRYDRVDPDSREWLRRHSIEFDGLIYDEDKYDVLADRVGFERVAFVLDDEMAQLIAAEKNFDPGVAVLRETWYNRQVFWPKSNPLLLGARDMANLNILDWRERHAQS